MIYPLESSERRFSTAVATDIPTAASKMFKLINASNSSRNFRGEWDGNRTYLVMSYGRAVAACLLTEHAEHLDGEWIVNAYGHSQTTTKHLNAFTRYLDGYKSMKMIEFATALKTHLNDNQD